MSEEEAMIRMTVGKEGEKEGEIQH